MRTLLMTFLIVFMVVGAACSSSEPAEQAGDGVVRAVFFWSTT